MITRTTDFPVRIGVLLDHEDIEWILLVEWNMHVQGYLKATIKPPIARLVGLPWYGSWYMHRAILAKHKLLKYEFHIDHINGDVLDNRKENLQQVTRSQNLLKAKLNKHNVSGHKNITPRGKSWEVKFNRNGRSFYCGSYKTLEQALQVRNTKEIELCQTLSKSPTSESVTD